MSPAISLDQLTTQLSPTQERQLQQGDVILVGSDGAYTVSAIVKAELATVWDVLTSYEQFPEFLPSVVGSRILERRENRVLVERKDRRKIGWLPIKVKIVTENTERPRDRIDYRMVDGTLDEMQGSWQLSPMEGNNAGHTLLVQEITAKASMGPLQPYFYEVFESGLTETMADLRTAMEQRQGN